VPADAHGLLALVDLDLGDPGFLEQFDQLLDLANVHGSVPVSAAQQGIRRTDREFVAQRAEAGDHAGRDGREIRAPPE
jgi:hypothetical protein